MDLEGRKDSFREADRRYAELERQRAAGSIDDRQFEEQRRRLMLQDDEGRWWVRSRETGEWLYHDGEAWVKGAPVSYEEETTVETGPPSARSPVPAAAGTGKRRRKWPWVLAAVVIVLTGLLGAGLLALSFLPSIPIPFGGEQRGGDGGSSPSGGGGTGAAFDAVFVHQATPDNISDNSTYLDNPSTNGNPDAVLYVTQNWNPGGEGGTYNDHEIGVWYDGEAGQWAIFNQDQEGMTEGAAFNVFVLEQAPR